MEINDKKLKQILKEQNEDFKSTSLKFQKLMKHESQNNR
jgi:hypothetical protein